MTTDEVKQLIELWDRLQDRFSAIVGKVIFRVTDAREKSDLMDLIDSYRDAKDDIEGLLLSAGYPVVDEP
jgi:hypothetical protein